MQLKVFLAPISAAYWLINQWGGGKQLNAINNRANRAYFTYKAPTMLVHQTA